MNLNQIKKDIDKVVEDYQKNWLEGCFGLDPKVSESFREKQIYKAMYFLSVIKFCNPNIENPIVLPSKGEGIPKDLEGIGLVFVWEHNSPEDENYFKGEMQIWDEGHDCISVNYMGEEWSNSFGKMSNHHVSDLGNLLKEETKRRENR